MQNPSDELLSIATDIREHLSYLHELGVENAEHSTQDEPRLESSAATGSSDIIENFRSRTAVSQTPIARPVSITAAAAKTSQPLPKSSPAAIDSLFGVLTPVSQRLEKTTETFEDIWTDVGNCTRCPLHQARTHIVHTEGNRRARLMFIGEAPGADEDAQARPFVGRAGQLLTKIIESIGFKREDVLIGNVNRCRPPGNRPPTEEEATTCKPFLLREIAAVQPEVIVVMGNTATRNLLNAKLGITKLRGEFQDYHGVKVMPTFHPAYLLRDPSKKQETWQDLKKVRDYLETSANSNP